MTDHHTTQKPFYIHLSDLECPKHVKTSTGMVELMIGYFSDLFERQKQAQQWVLVLPSIQALTEFFGCHEFDITDTLNWFKVNQGLVITYSNWQQPIMVTLSQSKQRWHDRFMYALGEALMFLTLMCLPLKTKRTNIERGNKPATAS